MTPRPDGWPEALHKAIATELRAAQGVASTGAPALSAMSGIKVDTIYRIMKEQRPPTVVEFIQLAESLGIDPVGTLERAIELATARTQPGRPSQSRRLAEKLSLIDSTLRSAPGHRGLFEAVTQVLVPKGYALPRGMWEDILAGRSPGPRAEVLGIIAEAVDVDPRYLTQDDGQVDVDVESRLRFRRAMSDLGVEQIAARSLSAIGPDELDAIEQSVRDALRNLGGTTE